MDIEGLIKRLNEHNVRYVVIGASAFPRHGWSRVTLDFDVFVEPTLPNTEKALKAVEEFGYDVSDTSQH